MIEQTSEIVEASDDLSHAPLYQGCAVGTVKTLYPTSISICTNQPWFLHQPKEMSNDLDLLIPKVSSACVLEECQDDNEFCNLI